MLNSPTAGLEPTGTDYCPRCDAVVDVAHQPLPEVAEWDVVCMDCKLIIDIVTEVPV